MTNQEGRYRFAWYASQSANPAIPLRLAPVAVPWLVAVCCRIVKPCPMWRCAPDREALPSSGLAVWVAGVPACPWLRSPSGPIDRQGQDTFR